VGRCFVYNPYEIAFCGTNKTAQGRMMTQVIAHGFHDTVVGCVLDRGTESGEFSIDMGINLFTGDGQHGLMYPAELDTHLGPRPLLDADFVFVETGIDSELPKVVWVEDGTPPKCDNVIAYVSEASACPVLPASATYFTDRNVQGVTSAIFEHFVARANDTPLYGLVLAGGRSERMGSDKAGLEYHGKPQAAHCCDLLSDFCDDVLVSIRGEQVDHAPFAGLNLMPDRFTGFGPIGGILTALLEKPEAAWLVLACDFPYMGDATLEHLVRNRNPFRSITLYIDSVGGLPESLCAIYEPKSVYRLAGFLAQGFNDLREVFSTSDSMFLEPPEEGSLSDVNTGEEFRSVHARLGGGYEKHE